MYVNEHWSGRALWRTVQIVIALVYVICACLLYALELSPAWVVAFWVVVIACWTAMLAIFVVRLLRARDRWACLRLQLSTLFLLLTPIPFIAPINNVYSVILLIVAFVFQVRALTMGNSLRFAAITVVGVVLFAAIGMGVAESAEPTGTINNFGESLLWAVAQVLRMDSLINLDPVTYNGRVLGAVVIFSGVLLAAIVFAGLTSWLVDERDHSGDAEEAVALERLIDRVVRTALSDALGPDAAVALGVRADDEEAEPDGTTIRVWLDTDRIAGSARGAWRRDRVAAVDELLRSLDASDPLGEPWSGLPLAGAPALPIAVLQGTATRLWTARESAEEAAPHAVRVERLPAPDRARDLIVQQARPGDVVVTSDPRLRDALESTGVTVAGIGPFRDLAARTG